jgi:hypothetical protein
VFRDFWYRQLIWHSAVVAEIRESRMLMIVQLTGLIPRQAIALKDTLRYELVTLVHQLEHG